MTRMVAVTAFLITLAAASAGAIAVTSGGGASEAAVTAATPERSAQAAKKKPIPYEINDLFIETNATDGDIGLQLLADVDEWDKFTLRDPKGRKLMMTAQTKGRLRHWGLTELFWETAEPEFSEVPLSKFKKRFPAGKYTFRGRSVDGRKIVGSDKLTHVIPDGPVITSPTRNEQVNANSLTVSWEPVTTPAGVEIATYQVIVVQEPVERVTLNLNADVTSVDIPAEALTPGAPETKVEVLAKEKSGNQTISEVPFSVK
jgi:hypothetical protein